MSDEPITNPLAEEWLRRAAGKWRLQVLQRRGRNVPSAGDHGWTRHELPIRLRRFLNGTPVGLVHDVLALLDREKDLKDPLFNWEPAGTLKPESYKPVRTYIVKDGNPNESNGRDPTYTIVQDLRLAEDEGDELTGVPSGDSCSQQEETDYFWDTPDVTVPADVISGQGVSYRVTNVSRDSETDLFSYQLQKQVAVTQHTPSHVVECTEFEEVYSESWDNLYGNTGSLSGHFYDNSMTRTGNVPGDMTEVILPEPCRQPDGTTVRVQVQENPDCTFRVTVETRVAKTDVRRQSETRKTLRGVTESETVVATSRMSERGLELGEQVRNELRPDGLYDVTHVMVSKESVGDIGSQCQKTIFEHEHAELRNEATRPEAEADSAGGGVIREVSSRATEEGTWDVTRKTVVEQNVKSARVVKQKTLRGVTSTVVERNATDGSASVGRIGDRVEVEKTPGGLYNRTVTSVSAKPVGTIGSQCQMTVFQHEHTSVSNVTSGPSGHVAGAGCGVVHERSSRATEEGTWDVTERTVTELSVPGAQKSKQKTLRGVIETTVDRNVGDGSVSVTNVGDRVQVEKTPGGMWNRTVTTVSKEPVGSIGSACERTVFEHRHVESENVVNRPEKEAGLAGGGKTYQVQARATDEGTWDVSRTTVVETKSEKAQHAKKKTLRGVTETYVDRNVESDDVTVSNIGDEVRVERTPGGLYNRTVTTVSPVAVGEIGKSCTVTPSVHTDTTLSNVPNGSQPNPQHQNPAVNIERTVETRRTDEGTWDVTQRTVTHQPWGEQLIARSENNSQTVEIHAFQNLTAVPPMTAANGQSISASASRNNVGSFDGSFRVTTGRPWGVETIAIANNNLYSTEVNAFQNLDSVPAISAQTGEVLRSASVSRNDLGLFDGNYRVDRATPYDSGWVTWDSKTTTSRGTYKYHHGLRLFKNQESPLLDGMKGASVQVSAGVNEYGLFDGQLTYSDLYAWEESGGGRGGGHMDGTITFVQSMVDATGKTYRRNVSVRVTTYYGTGNEGSEASVASNQIIPQGLSLPPRTYVNGNPSYGRWDPDV